MQSLLPVSVSASAPSSAALPLCRDVLWADGAAVMRSGLPVIVTGLQAVQGWIWRALMTARYGFRIHTNAYGCELPNLIGQPYSDAVKRAEACRMVEDALRVNPYIRAVRDIKISLSGAAVQISCTVDTVYGEVSANV